ncbi:allophanate hydrolase [Claveliimonas bilis]|uniref:5-oxoprolinase subunit C family protein n=1 Tax=Claveliimonas bilis TaxID=3028070 RepID=UPI001E3E26B5|nr:biotin-dependent carboxyltransferase family protein [Claveliimonas bilis]BCZ27606.1 allophanate hydrolase [Claveliimonas bilis]BDZ83705.1 allophanate hydrolase [Claveliimonas bilis]
MGIIVENPGIQTTVQDEGRFGYQQFGVSPAGPMDTQSFYIANILTGNRRGESALEITFMGPELKFEKDNIIAVTGANVSPSVNGEAIPMYRAVLVHAGDTLSFGVASGGSRAYIAFSGGLDVPVVMGSKATLMRNKLGGVEGRKLEKGDRIGFCCPRTTLPNMEMRRMEPEVFPQGDITLRVVTGPQDSAFTEEEVRKFFWYSAVITNESDRMGIRLEREEPLKHIKDGNILTDGVAFGSIQVPTNGQVIIMMADRQTTGGYTKIGTVISVDLPKLAQAQPGYKVHFVRVGIQLAQELYLRNKKKLQNLEKKLGQRS